MATPDPPRVLLLDTITVVFSWRYRIGDEGYDLIGALRHLAQSGQERLALDLLSLDELFSLARIGGALRFVIAPITFEELRRSRDAERSSMIQWASELATYDGLPDEWPFDRPSKRVAHGLLEPGVVGTDAVLLAEVARLRADALLTCNYRLIRRRNAGCRLDLVALTPFETEDWTGGCRQPPWAHMRACGAQLSRLALLREARRGLRLGDANVSFSGPVRAAH